MSIIPKGGIFTFDGRDMKKILKLEIKEANADDWKSHENHSILYDDGKMVEFVINQISPGEYFGIRILVINEDESYDLFFCEKLQWKGEEKLL